METTHSVQPTCTLELVTMVTAVHGWLLPVAEAGKQAMRAVVLVKAERTRPGIQSLTLQISNAHYISSSL